MKFFTFETTFLFHQARIFTKTLTGPVIHQKRDVYRNNWISQSILASPGENNNNNRKTCHSMSLPREPEEKQEEHWKELTQYFGINDRLKPPPCSRPPLMVTMISTIFLYLSVGVLIPLWCWKHFYPTASFCSLPTVCVTRNCFLYQMWKTEWGGVLSSTWHWA